MAMGISDGQLSQLREFNWVVHRFVGFNWAGTMDLKAFEAMRIRSQYIAQVKSGWPDIFCEVTDCKRCEVGETPQSPFQWSSVEYDMFYVGPPGLRNASEVLGTFSFSIRPDTEWHTPEQCSRFEILSESLA
jgi:hypothetical protein